ALWACFFTKVPFVPTPEVVVKDAVRLLKLDEQSKLYDMGCGDARVLIACWREEPRARYVGIEKDWIPWILANLRVSRLKKAHDIKILKKDFFTQDISDATHIFLYLSREILDLLLPRMKEQVNPGTRVVSCDYYFTNKEPAETIILDRSAGSLGRTLFVYEF
ncbi:MAG: hypothetical protein HYU05_01020, partial [Candidatus Wildermuthbacteria bacterium]|nr:hypothetical protein [Candidatus Wildermuthbacteria bacterium]